VADKPFSGADDSSATNDEKQMRVGGSDMGHDACLKPRAESERKEAQLTNRASLGAAQSEHSVSRGDQWSGQRDMEIELDLRAARIAQLQDELVCVYEKVATVRNEMAGLRSQMDIEAVVSVMKDLLAWRNGSYYSRRRDGLSLLAGKGLESPETIARLVAEISASDAFDRAWYLAAYPLVAKIRMSPAEHYLRYGAGEGKDPSPEFSTLAYLVRYPDVARSGLNPLLHYIRHGQAEGRIPGREQ
jgi:hypothetical protein